MNIGTQTHARDNDKKNNSSIHFLRDRHALEQTATQETRQTE